MPHQHWIISLYTALGQPGGGGSLYPFAIFFTYYISRGLMTLSYTLTCVFSDATTVTLFLLLITSQECLNISLVATVSYHN